MEKTKFSAKLPALIHRNEKAIEAEIFIMRDKREEIGNDIKTLTKSLSEWMGKSLPFDWVFGFVEAKEYEIDLLEDFQTRNQIPSTVRIEKIKEIYNVPDFSNIIKQAELLQGYEISYLFSFIKGENVVIPEVTKAEKEAVIEKHSIYILTEKYWSLYCAIKSLCDFANGINFDVYSDPTGRNKIVKTSLLTALPSEYVKFIDWEQPEEGTQKRRFVPIYENFRNK